MKKPIRISSLSSHSHYRNEGGFVLVVNGSQTAQWSEKAKVIVKSEGADKSKEIPLETRYQTGSQLEADWPATLNRKIQVYDVFVRDEDGSESNIMTYVVRPRGPEGIKIIPNTIPINPNRSTPVKLHISGDNFAEDVVVLANNDELERHRQSSVYITANLPAEFLKKAQDVEILIFNPGAKGDEPAKVTVQIIDPAKKEEEAPLPKKAEEAVKKAEEVVKKSEKEKKRWKWAAILEAIPVILAIIHFSIPSSHESKSESREEKVVSEQPPPPQQSDFVSSGKGICVVDQIKVNDHDVLILSQDQPRITLQVSPGVHYDASPPLHEQLFWVDSQGKILDTIYHPNEWPPGKERPNPGAGNIYLEAARYLGPGDRIPVTVWRLPDDTTLKSKNK